MSVTDLDRYVWTKSCVKVLNCSFRTMPFKVRWKRLFNLIGVNSGLHPFPEFHALCSSLVSRVRHPNWRACTIHWLVCTAQKNAPVSVCIYLSWHSLHTFRCYEISWFIMMDSLELKWRQTSIVRGGSIFTLVPTGTLQEEIVPWSIHKECLEVEFSQIRFYVWSGIA